MQYVLGLFLGSIPFILVPWESSVLFTYHPVLFIVFSLILYFGYVSVKKGVVPVSLSNSFPIILYVLILAVSSFFSLNSAQSIFGLGNSIYTLVTGCILLGIWLMVARTVLDMTMLQKTSIAYLSIATLIQMYLLVGYVFFSNSIINPFNTLVSASAYAAVTLFVSMYLYCKKIHVPLAVFSAMLSIVVLLLTNWYLLPGISMSLMVFALVSLYLYLVLGFQKSRYLLLLLFVIQVLSPLVSDVFMSRLNIRDASVQVEIGESIHVAEEVYGNSFRSMLFGTGPNTYTYVWHRYKSTELPGSVNITKYWDYDFTEAVSVVLTQVTTMGLLGLLFWLYLFVLIGSFATKSIQIKDSETLYLSVTLLALGIVLLFSSVNFGLYALFFVLTAILYAKFGDVIKVPDLGVASRYTAIIVICILLGIFVKELRVYRSVQIVDTALSELYSYTHQGLGELSYAEKQIEGALSYFDAPEYRRLLATIQLAQVDIEKELASTSFMVLKRAENVLSPSLGTSVNFRDWMLAGRVYEYQTLLGSTTSAPFTYQAYTAASLLAPTHPEPQYALALVHLYAGNTESARQSVRNVLMLKPNYNEALLLYKQLHATNTDILGNMGK